MLYIIITVVRKEIGRRKCKIWRIWRNVV